MEREPGKRTDVSAGQVRNANAHIKRRLDRARDRVSSPSLGVAHFPTFPTYRRSVPAPEKAERVLRGLYQEVTDILPSC
ncbi:hypothetical protein C0214_06700 [Methylobacterium sp. DM1]|uniref:Uncharacterized protein n=2 Tax=Methylorubrum extorquens TaxID=408 RepID=C5B3R9_METEA|nr:conserved hypothetical protein [Methylorubrum extorquens AM1]AWI87996.1 hypothetical protein C0214_06700 [Methylobacterium sp. DM1]CAX22859.1 protein of unknown function [Methylorubrum extorquens DM4]